jgi:hypothetical protein
MTRRKALLVRFRDRDLHEHERYHRDRDNKNYTLRHADPSEVGRFLEDELDKFNTQVDRSVESAAPPRTAWRSHTGISHLHTK